MKNKEWSKSDLVALKDVTKTNAQLAEALGRTEDAVRIKRGRLRILVPVIREEPSYSADTARANNELWKNKYNQLSKKYERALKENTATQQLVTEIKSLAPTSYSAAPNIIKARKVSGSAYQSCVLLFSDTHVGKVVTEAQTLGFGRYDFDTFLSRLKYLEESVVSILENHTTIKVSELVIAMLGDMLDGALLHGVESGQHNTLFTQYYAAGHAIAQFLRNLAAHVPKVVIRTTVGNHTRWQNQKRMPTENRFSNLDMFLYAYVEALTRDIKNIVWDLNMQPFAIFQVQGWTFHAAHGDHLKGGDRALGIPNHAIGREVSTTTQLFVKHNRQAPHYYVCGHLHREIQLPHALGSVIVNGGFPGLDNYALAEKFNPVDPAQKFFFVHPKYGKTAEYSLSLKFAEVGAEPPYIIPSTFPVQ